MSLGKRVKTSFSFVRNHVFKREKMTLIPGNTVIRFLSDERGAALVEYGMLLMLVALLCIILLQGIGKKVSNSFDAANSLLP